MSTDEQDVAYINEALAEIQRQAGRDLTEDEAHRLGDFAVSNRGDDGWPDIQLMADAFSVSEAAREFGIPPQDHEAFVEQAYAQEDADGRPDPDGAYAALYEQEPQPITLPPDATDAQREAYFGERAREIEQSQRQDLAWRTQQRRDAIAGGEDPGRPDADMPSWEGKDRDDMSPGELAGYMAHQVIERVAAAEAPEAA